MDLISTVIRIHLSAIPADLERQSSGSLGAIAQSMGMEAEFAKWEAGNAA